MLIYKDCLDDEFVGLQYTCDPCEITEGGRVRSLCLIKKGTTLTAPLTVNQLEILIAAGELFVMPETSGTFDGGTPKMVTGYGDNKEKRTGEDYVLMVKDPVYSDNYDFWQAVESREDWNIAFRTETQLMVVYSDVTITTKAPAEEGIDTDVIWNIEAKWFSKTKPDLIAYPAGLFDSIKGIYEGVTTLTIGSGVSVAKKVYLEVDSDLTCYVVTPNGTLLTSTAGKVATTWTGAAGKIKLIIPKGDIDTKIDSASPAYCADYLGEYVCNNPGTFSAAGSLLTSIVANNKQSVSVGGSGNLTNLSCSSALQIFAAYCANLSQVSIKRIIDDAVTIGENNGTIDLGNSTPVNVEDISAIHGKTYQELLDDLDSAGWSLTYEVAI